MRNVWDQHYSVLKETRKASSETKHKSSQSPPLHDAYIRKNEFAVLPDQFT
jgi:hypothetical protein